MSILSIVDVEMSPHFQGGYFQIFVPRGRRVAPGFRIDVWNACHKSEKFKLLEIMFCMFHKLHNILVLKITFSVNNL